MPKKKLPKGDGEFAYSTAIASLEEVTGGKVLSLFADGVQVWPEPARVSSRLVVIGGMTLVRDESELKLWLEDNPCAVPYGPSHYPAFVRREVGTTDGWAEPEYLTVADVASMHHVLREIGAITIGLKGKEK